MENIGQKKKPCEEKIIFAPQMASEYAFKKCGYHLWKSNFKVQDTTKSFKQKRCVMIHLNVPNFLYIYENPVYTGVLFMSQIFHFRLNIFEFVKFYQIL